MYAAVASQIDAYACHDDGEGYGVACPRYQASQPFQLLVEWRFHRIVDLRGLEHLSAFGGIAHGGDFHNSVAFDNLSPFENFVGGEGGLGVGVGGVDTLGANGFAGEGGLIHIERHCFQQSAVGGYFLSGGKQNDVAHNNIAAGNFCDMSLADNLHRFVVVDFVEDGELTFGAKFENEAEAGGEQNGHDNAGRLEEYCGALPESPVVVAGYAHRKHSRYQQHDYERVFEFLQKPHPGASALRFGENVGSVACARFLYLLRGEPAVYFMFRHRLTVWICILWTSMADPWPGSYVSGAQSYNKIQPQSADVVPALT